MSDVIISVENLGKKYRIRHQQGERYTALRDVIAEKAKGFFKKLKTENLKLRNNVSISKDNAPLSACQNFSVSAFKDVSASPNVSVSAFQILILNVSF